MFTQELLGNLNSRKQLLLGPIFQASRVLVLPCLLQVDTVGRTVERQFSLLTATLRADALVDRRTEALRLSNVAECTNQSGAPPRGRTRRKLPLWHLPVAGGSAGP